MSSSIEISCRHDTVNNFFRAVTAACSVAVLWFLTPELQTKWPFVDCSVDWLILWINQWINNLYVDFLLDL